MLGAPYRKQQLPPCKVENGNSTGRHRDEQGNVTSRGKGTARYSEYRKADGICVVKYIQEMSQIYILYP